MLVDKSFYVGPTHGVTGIHQLFNRLTVQVKQSAEESAMQREACVYVGLFELFFELGRGIVFVANKLDLIDPHFGLNIDINLQANPPPVERSSCLRDLHFCIEK